MVPSEEELNRIFLLADQVASVEHQLIHEFPELSFIWYADDVFAWLERNYGQVAGLLAAGESGGRSSDLRSLRAGILFHLGNYLASAQAAVDFLYNYGKRDRFSEDLLKHVTARTDELKNCPAQRVLTGLRNRMVHSPPLFDTLFASVRTVYHPGGEGTDLGPVLTEAAIAGIDERLTKEPPVQALWAQVKTKNSCGLNWLTPLVTDHLKEARAAFEYVKECARSTYSDSYAEYQRLAASRAELETAIAKHMEALHARESAQAPEVPK